MGIVKMSSCSDEQYMPLLKGFLTKELNEITDKGDLKQPNFQNERKTEQKLENQEVYMWKITCVTARDIRYV